MRNGKRLLAALLGAVFMLGAAGGVLAQDDQGQIMTTEPDQTTPQMLMMDSGKMSHGMMSQGMMGHHKMGKGMMGHHKMGKGKMHPGMMNMLGGGIPKLMSSDEVKAMLRHWLSRHIGDRVKVGAVEELGVFAFGVDVTTVDGSLVIQLPQPGTLLAQNALAAAALGLLLDVPRASIVSAIESFTLPPGRGEILQFNVVTVIDDSYNANLASTLAGLETLAQMPSGGRRIAVLGDMQELGRFSEEYHRQVGAFAAARGVDALLCYGPETRETYCTALSAGLDARHFTDRSELAHVLSRSVNTGDVVYVKGSRGMAMETVITEAFRR